MISRKKKEEIVEQLVEKFSRAQGIYFVDFQGMSVAQAITLRRAFREKDVEYKVAKNNLILRALQSAGKDNIPAEKLVGQTGIALSYNDPVSPSKIIKEFADKNEKFRLKAASIEGELFDGSQLETITKLPTKQDVIAGILASLDSPASGIVRAIGDPATGIVRALEAVTRDLAYVIEEVAKKRNVA